MFFLSYCIYDFWGKKLIYVNLFYIYLQSQNNAIGVKGNERRGQKPIMFSKWALAPEQMEPSKMCKNGTAEHAGIFTQRFAEPTNQLISSAG